MPPRYAYLGPAGTFAETALRGLPESRDAELIPVETVADAFAAVRDGSVDGAVVPFENSVEGAVTGTLDEFATGSPLQIAREMLVPVRLSLLARAGTDLGGIRVVASHPHATAQCRHWLRAHLPEARVRAAPSTAEAAAAVAEGAGAADAAIASPAAGTRYGLTELAADIGDHQGAVTRFVMAVEPRPLPPPTGADRTTVVTLIADDHPGALLELLTEFAVRGVNLTRIESPPHRPRVGPVLLLDRLRGAHRGRPRGGRPGRPASVLRGGQVLRLLPASGRRGPPAPLRDLRRRLPVGRGVAGSSPAGPGVSPAGLPEPARPVLSRQGPPEPVGLARARSGPSGLRPAMRCYGAVAKPPGSRELLRVSLTSIV